MVQGGTCSDRYQSARRPPSLTTLSSTAILLVSSTAILLVSSTAILLVWANTPRLGAPLSEVARHL